MSPAPVVFSAVPTLFSSDGEVDAGANRTLYKFVAGLLDGLLVAGTTGEFPALENRHHQLAQFAVPVLLHPLHR